MTEIEIMQLLDKKEDRHLANAIKAISERNDYKEKYNMSSYLAISYLKLRIHTKFKGVKEICTEELSKIFNNMSNKYDDMANRALCRGDLEEEAKWLGVYLMAHVIAIDLKALARIEKVED